MIKTLPKSQQTLIYLTGGLTMITASLSIFGSLPMSVFLFSIVIGIISITQIELQFAKGTTKPSTWGLDLLRISRKMAPEAYTSVEITPVGYKPHKQIEESLTKITAYIISRAAKHIKTQKTAIKIDELEETSMLYIQIKGSPNSKLEANQLVQVTDEEIEEFVKELSGSTMYESNDTQTTILIEFPNPKNKTKINELVYQQEKNLN